MEKISEKHWKKAEYAISKKHLKKKKFAEINIVVVIYEKIDRLIFKTYE